MLISGGKFVLVIRGAYIQEGLYSRGLYPGFYSIVIFHLAHATTNQEENEQAFSGTVHDFIDRALRLMRLPVP